MNKIDEKIKEVTNVLDKFGDEKIRANLEPISAKIVDIMNEPKTKWILLGFGIGFVVAALIVGLGAGTDVIDMQWGNQVG